MKLSEKEKNFLNSKCIEKFGATFDQVYLMIEQQEKLKQQNKELRKKQKSLKKLC